MSQCLKGSRRAKPLNAGSTLIEIVVTMTLLMVVFGSIVGAFLQAQRGIVQVAESTEKDQLLSDIMVQVRKNFSMFSKKATSDVASAPQSENDYQYRFNAFGSFEKSDPQNSCPDCKGKMDIRVFLLSQSTPGLYRTIIYVHHPDLGTTISSPQQISFVVAETN